MRVVLDTNTIQRGGFRFRGTAFRLLLNELKTQGHVLYVPQIVMDEVVNNYRKELKEIQENVGNKLGKASSLMGRELTSPISEADIEIAVDDYRRFLIQRLEAAEAVILDYPDTIHRDLAQRSMQQRKPFRSEDRGYRDALIWENIRSLAAREVDQPIIFICANPRDFAGEEGNLHPDLRDDLTTSGAPHAQVDLCNEVKDFVDQYIRPHLSPEQEIKAQLQANEFSKFRLDTFLDEGLPEFVATVELEPQEIGFPAKFEMPRITMIERISEISEIDVRRASSNELLITFAADVTAVFDIFLLKSDYYSEFEDSVSVIDHDWNDHYVAAEESLDVHMRISLTFDTEKGSVTSAQLDEIVPRRDWWEQSEMKRTGHHRIYNGA
jgi:hypothetical protein